MQDIIESIRAHREAEGRSQSAVARLAGLAQPNYSKIELGKINPRLSTVLDIARALDLELVLVPKAALPAVQALSAAKPGESRLLFRATGD